MAPTTKAREQDLQRQVVTLAQQLQEPQHSRRLAEAGPCLLQLQQVLLPLWEVGEDESHLELPIPDSVGGMGWDGTQTREGAPRPPNRLSGRRGRTSEPAFAGHEACTERKNASLGAGVVAVMERLIRLR